MNQKRPKRRKSKKNQQPSVGQPRGLDRLSGSQRAPHPLRRYFVLLLLAVTIVVPLGWWSLSQSTFLLEQPEQTDESPGPIAKPPILSIVCPFDDSLFPPEIAPTLFRWDDGTAGVDGWRIEIAFEDGEAPLQTTRADCQWTPSTAEWERIKRHSLDAPATVTICGFHHESPQRMRSEDAVSIRTSRDEVGAPIFYREVNLPFVEAVKDPAAHIRWRFGSIEEPEQPHVIMQNMPLCGNCHSFSRDGSLVGMDVDYGNDKGSYVISPVSKEMVYDNEKIITWADYEPDDNRGTLGLLSQVSPDGRYVISTVKDRSVFVPVDDLEFSQLFFPIQGILAYYDRQTQTFHALPGADDDRYVQSNATWSPDGKYIVYARSKAYHSAALNNQGRGLSRAEDVSEFLDGRQQFKFDLWRIEFNNGKGGEPKPLLGASNNGMSNYFAKYSPDGKWIAFCRAKNFMLLQPDSELYVIPAQGGEARRLACNTSRMNSWHSWSPNSKWLVFSSKAFSPYTQLFLTHVDDQGCASRPVVLSHFTSPDMAANIPEFVNTTPHAIRNIQQRFVDDLSYLQTGKYNVQDGDYALAIQAFRKALEINPKNAEAHIAWGNALFAQGNLDEARKQYLKVLQLEPANKNAYWLLGAILEKQDQLPAAISTYQQALSIDPNYALAHHSIGRLELKTGATESGREHLLEAARFDPENASPYMDLAQSFLAERRFEQARSMYRQALERAPNDPNVLMALAISLIQDPGRQPGDVHEALGLALKSCELTGDKDPFALIVLADVHAAAGRMDDALTVGHRALAIAEQAGNPNVADTIRARIETYRRD